MNMGLEFRVIVYDSFFLQFSEVPLSKKICEFEVNIALFHEEF